MSWRPATRDETLSALAAEKATIDADILRQFDDCWVQPCTAVVNRFGEDEHIYVVARSASERDGRLTDAMDFGHLALALREMRRMERL